MILGEGDNETHPVKSIVCVHRVPVVTYPMSCCPIFLDLGLLFAKWKAPTCTTEIFFFCLTADSHPLAFITFHGMPSSHWVSIPALVYTPIIMFILLYCNFLLTYGSSSTVCVLGGRERSRLGPCLIHYTPRPGPELELEIHLLEEKIYPHRIITSNYHSHPERYAVVFASGFATEDPRALKITN